MKIFSKLILIILLTSCDDSHNTNTEEMENALSNMYWTIQSGTISNDVIHDITIDKNDNIYLSGYSQGSLDGYSNIGNRDVILLKYDKSGKIEWSSQFGTTSNDEGKGIESTPLWPNSTTIFADFSGNLTHSDSFLYIVEQS